MTKINQAPNLYVTSDFVEKAQDEGVTGVAARNSAREVIRRGGQGRLDGLSVSRLLLHTTTDIDEAGRVFRVPPYEHSDRFITSDRPGTNPREFVAQGLSGEAHTLVVPTVEFDETGVAWSLHNAAARYSQDFPSAPGERQMRAPTEGFGVPAIDRALGFATQFLGRSIHNLQANDKRERPEDLAAQLQQGLGSIIGQGMDIIRDVQGLGNEPTNEGEGQPLVQPFTLTEMAQLIEENPPIVFYPNEQ